jgi:hypothetical protein
MKSLLSFIGAILLFYFCYREWNNRAIYWSRANYDAIKVLQWIQTVQIIHKKTHGTYTDSLQELVLIPESAGSEFSSPRDHVENQFTKVFSKYYYLGTFPIDFDMKSETGECLVSALCSMNIQELYKKGFTQIGIVFNTDVSSGPGKHWVAVFCDIGSEFEYPRITYFDSYSHKPEKEIQRLMKRWREQWVSAGVHSKPMVLSYNKTRHQYEDSECGMYCLYFHFCCLLGIPMEERIPDPVVRGLRGMLFRVGKK